MAMRSSALRLMACAALISAVALVGCSKNSESPSAPAIPPGQAADLNAPNGGYTATNETPSFGDPAVEAQVALEKDVNDPMASDPVVRGLASHPYPRMYAVNILWGKLQQDGSTPGDSDGSEFDWSGSLTIERGAIVVLTTVSFEEGDSLLRRTAREKVEWNSHTGQGFDGIRVLVYPPVRDSLILNDQVTLSMPLYTHTFTLSELERLSETVSVDSSGNQVSVTSFRIPPTSNSAGFLRGQWNAIGGDSIGTYAGVWVGQSGRISGTMQGRYGYSHAGARVLFGKVIDENGIFRGFVRGTWEPSSGNPPIERGTFQGDWVDGSGRTKATMRGNWRLPLDRPGVYEGNWCTSCP